MKKPFIQPKNYAYHKYAGASVGATIGMAALSKAADFGMNRLSSSFAGGQSGRAARKAYDRSVKMYRNRYQWTARDMRKAGLNPILAASGGFNVGGGIQAPMAQTFQAAPSESMSSAYQQFTQGDKQKEETKVAAEQVTNVANQAQHELKKMAQTDVSVRKLAQETSNLIQQHKKIIAEIAKTEADASIRQELAKSIKRITESWENILNAWDKFTSNMAPKFIFETYNILKGFTEDIMEPRPYGGN